MDQYLLLDSHHNLLAKYSVFNTLSHMARVVCSNQQMFKEEEDHIRQLFLGVIIQHGL